MTQALPASMAERMANAAACMQAQGINAVLRNGGIELRSAPPSGVPWKELMQRCIHDNGADEQPPTLSDAEVRKLYDHWVSMAACLTKLGYPPDPAPSWDAFLPSYRSGAGLWDPWGANVPPEAWNAANEACPQQVPGLSG